MKYDLLVNQKAIIEHGFEIDVKDAVILDYCLTFAQSGKCQTLIVGELTYYWFDHQNICDQLPILRIEKDTLYKRMKALCEKSFLKAYPENKKENRSWYAIDKNTYLIESTIGKKSDGTNKSGSSQAQKPSEKNPMVDQDEWEPSEKNPKGIGKKSEGPSEKNPMYNTIREEGNNNTHSSRVRARTRLIAKKSKALRSAQKRKTKIRGIPRVPPKPKPTIARGDPFLFRSNSEKTNVPFSRWFLAYDKRVNEDGCRMAWLDLTDAERLQAMEHTPGYVKSTFQKWVRKDPKNYLELKAFNDEIIARTPITPPAPEPIVIQTKLKSAKPD